jgi:hypothetical protein
MKKKVFPLISSPQEPVFFFLIDNLRYDQWKILESILQEYFNVDEESVYYSICPPPRPLPATPSSRACCPAKWKSTTPTCG